MSTNGRLRELIRAVRSCKTAAEERGLIQRECATIRQSFKENREYTRSSSMLKLLYITMLGYSTEFGQMEVVKLISQPEYGAKRIGYLTLAVVLDETHEVLTLAENHIKKDLVNSNTFVQALALDVVANIAGEDMARDVLHEVEQLLDSPNLYLRKKASLAALRIVKKAPDHAEIFLEKLQSLFNERNHNSLMCSLTLVNQCLQTEQGEALMGKYRQLVTSAVRVLKQLVLSSKVTDLDIGGVSDPFLQIKLLQFLRITGTGSAVASEAMNDVLAQVATNTDSSKNVGSAVHYECVKTINAVVSDEGLRVLGINTIGRFLTSVKDNNVRFVALAMLLKLVRSDVAAVQRHQATIIDCLKDPDLSIRRRALELTVALIDETSVRILVPDLMQYLQACTTDMKAEVAEQIASVIEEKSPSAGWRVELSIRLFKVARHYVPVPFSIAFIAFVTQQSADIHASAVNGLWEEVSGPLDGTLQSCQALLLAAVWLLGEYGSAVVASGVRPMDIGSSLATVTTNTVYTNVKQFGLTALMKLTTRYPGELKTVALSVFDIFASNLDCELQQRSCEYTTLLESFDEVAKFSFSAMPAITCSDEEAQGGASAAPIDRSSVVTTTVPATAPPNRTAIDDLFGPPPPAMPTTTTAAPTTTASTSSTAHKFTTDDLFGPSPTSNRPPAMHHAPESMGVRHAPPPVPQQPQPTTPSTPLVDDLFGPSSSASKPVPSTTPAAPERFSAFQCEDCTVTMSARFQPPATLDVEAVLIPTTARLRNVTFHVAVPRTSSIEVHPLPINEAGPGSSIHQRLVVTSSAVDKAKSLMLRVKLVYSKDGQPKEHLFQVSKEI